MKIDWDEVLSYETIAVVKIRDRRLGILYYTFLMAITIYVIIYQVIVQQGYLIKEPPIGGSIRISVKPPVFSEIGPLSKLSYCDLNSDGSPHSKPKCVYSYFQPPLEESAALITTRYGPSLRRQIPYSPFLTDEGVLILNVRTRWLKVILTSTMYIVIMPVLLITINWERGKEVRAGTEKYVLSESEMGLIVNVTCVEGKQAVASESASRGKDSINHLPWYDM